MREVIRGVVDVLRTAGVRRAERHSHDDGEPFVMPPETEDTREDTAYTAAETRDTAPKGRGESEGGRGQQKARGDAAQQVRSGRVQADQAQAEGDSDADAQFLRGMDRLATAGLDETSLEDQSAATFSDKALGMARDLDGEQAADPRLERSSAPDERLAESASDELTGESADREAELDEAMRRLELARQASSTRSNARVSTERAESATTAVGQRVVAEETSAANVTMGQDAEGEDDLIEEAASAAFDKAQALRDGGSKAEQPTLNRMASSLPSGVQVLANPTTTPTAEALVPEAVGNTSVTETLMEEIMVAQRGAAGGDRVGDADTVIRISEGAAGALQVKVKREGDDLSLRVRAEDLAMRHVMAESLPELKHELQKANLVEGEIEVREDGIEDQMQSEYTWDENQSTRRDSQQESGHEGDAVYGATSKAAQPSDTTKARRHDGELHVVA